VDKRCPTQSDVSARLAARFFTAAYRRREDGFADKTRRQDATLFRASGSNLYTLTIQARCDFQGTGSNLLSGEITKPATHIMKRIVLTLIAVAGSVAIAADVAETTTTTTKTTVGTGTVTEYVPSRTFIVKETSGPVTYRYGKKVTYVTKSGRVLTDDDVRTRIKVGVPVSVQYATEGDARIINRVEIDD
jgi:hypothetical protein